MNQSGPSINTTPLIDVLLVLLVLLVITLPRSTHLIGLDLPIPDASKSSPLRPADVEVDFDGLVFWNGSLVPDDRSLEQRFIATASTPTLVRILPDRHVRYERVAQVLASAQRAHVQHLTLAPVSN